MLRCFLSGLIKTFVVYVYYKGGAMMAQKVKEKLKNNKIIKPRAILYRLTSKRVALLLCEVML